MTISDPSTQRTLGAGFAVASGNGQPFQYSFTPFSDETIAGALHDVELPYPDVNDKEGAGESKCESECKCECEWPVRVRGASRLVEGSGWGLGQNDSPQQGLPTTSCPHLHPL